MASRFITSSALRTLARPSPARSFQTSSRQLNATFDAASALPASRPVGAFRGGFVGFLLGSSIAAYGTYSWVLKEYRLANELLTEDIYALQAAVQRIHTYVATLEQKVDALQKN